MPVRGIRRDREAANHRIPRETVRALGPRENSKEVVPMQMSAAQLLRYSRGPAGMRRKKVPAARATPCPGDRRNRVPALPHDMRAGIADRVARASAIRKESATRVLQ